MIPLSLADAGVPQIVKRLGGTPEVKQHLADLGFHIGGEVTVVSALGGNVIVRVKDARIAVSEALARKIMV